MRFQQVVPHRIARLRAQAAHAILGVFAGERGEVHQRDGLQQPRCLPFLLHRPPAAERCDAALHRGAVDARALDPVSVVRRAFDAGEVGEIARWAGGTRCGVRAMSVLSEKRSADRHRLHAEVAGDGLSDVGERVARADRAGRNARAEGDDRHMLARVIAAGPGRIAAVVGREDDEIAWLQLGLQFGQAPVERFERRGIARHVAAMAVEHVEIDEVREQDAAVGRAVELLQRFFEQRFVSVGAEALRDALLGEDVADLADADHFAAVALRRDRATSGRAAELHNRGGCRCV